MSNYPNSGDNRSMTPRSGGFFSDLTDRFRLISRLMMDSRVNPFIKVLPVGALLYALWPFDIPTPIDDVFVIWLGTTLFVQLCPPDVVEEHTSLIERKTGRPVGWQDFPKQEPIGSQAAQGDVIDGEYYENDPKKNRTTR